MASPITPKNTVEQEKILQSALEEVRIKYQNLNATYTSLGSKIFTLIATELVILTFIFSFEVGDNQALFQLDSPALVTFFGIGTTATVIALGLLFWAATSNKWAEPAEKKELSLLRYLTHIDYLQDMKDDYLIAIRFCAGRYSQRRIAFDWSVILFVFGAILLMVIKIGG